MKNRTAWWPAIAFGVLLLAGSAGLLTGCGGNEVAPTVAPETGAAPEPTTGPAASPEPPAPETGAAPEPTTGPPASPEPPAPETAGTPAETLAKSGEGVYAAECAGCHGKQGEGLAAPALIGDGAGLVGATTAQELYDFVHLAMPQGAPGSLTEQQYLEVVTYVLLENALVEPNTPLSLEGLSSVPLK